ncbi:MAG: AraC family transcriptional regulator [Sphingomonadales bacterium]|nr:AraC family transcriptional regulator [Sphingomonadales bacterium]
MNALEDPAPRPLQVGRVLREMRLRKARIRVVEYPAQPFDVRGTLDHFRLELALDPARKAGTGSIRFPEDAASRTFESAGDLLLLVPGRLMHSRGESVARRAIAFEFSADAYDGWFAADAGGMPDRGEGALDIGSPVIRATLRRLATEMIDPGFGHAVMCELLAAQIALDLARYCRRRSDSPRTGGLSPHRLNMIEQRLGEIAPPPTLEELARLSRLSVRQLTRGFRASRQCSIGAFAIEKRMDNARRLLASDMPITRIAGALGFASAASFSTAFSKATGRCPREFRAILARDHAGVPG